MMETRMPDSLRARAAVIVMTMVAIVIHVMAMAAFRMHDMRSALCVAHMAEHNGCGRGDSLQWHHCKREQQHEFFEPDRHAGAQFIRQPEQPQSS